MSYLTAVLILNFIISRSDVSCQSNHQICIQEMKTECQNALRDKIKDLDIRLITSELCCPVIEARDCISKAFSACELATIPKSRYSLSPADCKRFDDGVSCDYATITRNKPDNNRSGRYSSSDHKNGERESDTNATEIRCCNKFSVLLLISLFVLLFSA